MHRLGRQRRHDGKGERGAESLALLIATMEERGERRRDREGERVGEVRLVLL